MYLYIPTPAVRRFLETRLTMRFLLVAPLVIYPIAVFSILNHGRFIFSARAVPDGIDELLDRVERGKSVNGDDLKCLNCWFWHSVPWKELEHGNYRVNIISGDEHQAIQIPRTEYKCKKSFA